MQAVLNFVIGGGLLALVQAILGAYNLAQAKLAGANSAKLAASQKALSDAETTQQIDSNVGAMPSAVVDQQLQQFERN